MLTVVPSLHSLLAELLPFAARLRALLALYEPSSVRPGRDRFGRREDVCREDL